MTAQYPVKVVQQFRKLVEYLRINNLEKSYGGSVEKNKYFFNINIK